MEKRLREELGSEWEKNKEGWEEMKKAAREDLHESFRDQIQARQEFERRNRALLAFIAGKRAVIEKLIPRIDNELKKAEHDLNALSNKAHRIKKHLLGKVADAMKAGNFDSARQSLKEFNDQEWASEQDIGEKRMEIMEFESIGGLLREMVSGRYLAIGTPARPDL